MSEIRIYNVLHQSKYGIELESVRNIEDAGEHFVTSEEMEEMGITSCYGRHQLFKNKIKDEIQRLLSTIKKGRKSCIIDDEDLVEILKSSQTPVSEIVEGTRRVGNRLFRHTKAEKTKPQKRDAQTLINRALSLTTEGHDFYLEFKYVSGDGYGPAIRIVKKLVTWKDLSEALNEEDVKWVKMVWDKPDTFKEIKE